MTFAVIRVAYCVLRKNYLALPLSPESFDKLRTGFVKEQKGRNTEHASRHLLYTELPRLSG
jgi:hypothetical protein